MKDTNKMQNFFIKGFGIDRYLEQWERNKSLNNSAGYSEKNYDGLEYKTWHLGKSEEIEYFYKSIYKNAWSNKQYKFWRVVNTTMPRLHYPLPRMISRAMGTLLFNQTPEFTVDAGSQTRNKKLQKRLDEILDENDILVTLQNAADLQSYSGSVALKQNYDDTISNSPLITVYPQEDFKVHKTFGKVIYIDFMDKIEEDYKLISRYGTGYINYQLYYKERLVPLSTLPQTSGLTDIAFFDNDGYILPVMFATVIENKGKQSESDYKGLTDTFHALDETYSTLLTYIRRTKPIVYITEDIAKKDNKGNPLPLNEFDNIITVLDQAIGEGNTKIDRSLEEIKIIGYKETLVELREFALAEVGLSPATLGFDAGGSNQSGEALNIRERASGRLRGEKLANWTEKLNQFLYSMVVFDDLMKNSQQVSEGTYYSEQIADFVVISNFGEFQEQTLSEKAEIYTKLFEKGLVSIEFAVEKIFGSELSEEQQLVLVIQLKNEKGVELTVPQLEYVAKQNEKRNKV